VIVEGPFGVVSAAELIGIILFSAFVIWGIVMYALEDLDTISEYQLAFKEQWYISIHTHEFFDGII
jgi:ferric-chelate reductase